MKQLLMKVKEGNAKAGQHLNIKKTKFLTIKEMHNFNRHKEAIEVVQGYACCGSVIHASGDPAKESREG